MQGLLRATEAAAGMPNQSLTMRPGSLTPPQPGPPVWQQQLARSSSPEKARQHSMENLVSLARQLSPGNVAPDSLRSRSPARPKTPTRRLGSDATLRSSNMTASMPNFGVTKGLDVKDVQRPIVGRTPSVAKRVAASQERSNAQADAGNSSVNLGERAMSVNIRERAMLSSESSARADPARFSNAGLDNSSGSVPVASRMKSTRSPGPIMRDRVPQPVIDESTNATAPQAQGRPPTAMTVKPMDGGLQRSTLTPTPGRQAEIHPQITLNARVASGQQAGQQAPSSVTVTPGLSSMRTPVLEPRSGLATSTALPATVLRGNSPMMARWASRG
jgi:hypothetical protein